MQLLVSTDMSKVHGKEYLWFRTLFSFKFWRIHFCQRI